MKKGIILCGGQGTRLGNLTKQYGNKHMVNIHNDTPMCLYPLTTLKQFGINDVLLITSPENCGAFTNLLRSGSDFDVEMTYKVQTQPDGILGALKLAKDFVSTSDDFMVILGDNYFELNQNKVNEQFLNPYSEKLREQFTLFTKHVSTNASQYGCLINNNVEKIIVEKPYDAISGDVITGLYHYPNEIFDVINSFSKSARGEYEITDLNNYIIQNFYDDDYNFEYKLSNQENWLDCGTLDNLKKVRKYLFKKELLEQDSTKGYGSFL